MKNSCRSAVLLLTLAFCSTTYAQTTVILQNGSNYNGTTDAWISCCDASNFTLGLQNEMELRAEGSDSGVIQFKIFASEGGLVPDGAAVSSAVLSVYKYAGIDGQFKASRLLRGWDETTVTWNSPWLSPGAQSPDNDYVSGSLEQGSVGTGAAWLDINVTDSVQRFANASATNYGWKIAQIGDSGAYKNFVSKDNNNEGLRPKLTITYTYNPNAPCNTGTLRPFDQAPINGNPIPISSGTTTFEAEHFNCGGQNNAYYDKVAGNIWGLYRTTEDVDITTSAGGNGYVVNNFETDEWLTYKINVLASGSYSVGIKASNNLQAATFHVDVSNIDAGNISVPITGSWDQFNWYDSGGVWLNAGEYVVKLRVVQQYANVDQLRLVRLAGGGGDCTAEGLQLCVGFEPDTTFAGNTVTTPSLGGSISWFAQNFANDSATDTSRIGPSSFSREGTRGIMLQTQENDINVHSSGDWERSEIQMSKEDSATLAGTESWWADSLYIPNGVAMPSATDTQVVLFQFHGNYGSAPNFALSIINQTGNSPHKVFRAYTAGNTTNQGLDGIGGQYTYHIDDVKRPGQCVWDSVETGVWYDFVHHITWSADGHGSHQIWMRKDGGSVFKVLDQQGISTVYAPIPPATQPDQPYLKIGVYHTAVSGTTSVIHDRIRRGSSADAVRMSDFPVVLDQPLTLCSNVTLDPH